jgi:hypothetical protein
VKTSKANWRVLYALLPLAVVLLVAADLEASTAGWRRLAELGVSLGFLGVMALWVRANRIALALEGRADITAQAVEDTTGTPAHPHALLALNKRAA